jgi:hypothetical protein
VNRAVSVLLLVLLIQCGILAAVFWPRQGAGEGTIEQGLTPFAADAIDELRIGDQFDNETILVKADKQWLLPELDNLPADPAKVDAVLKAVTSQTGSWPIARTPAARQRFQVADYLYERRLTLMSAGKNLGTVYLGTSPGYRKVHARNEAQDAIYSISLNTFDAPAVGADWLEPRLLQVRAPLRIDADLYNLRFENGVWLSGTGGTPDAKELDALIGTLKSLQVGGVADEDAQRELSTVEADLELKIQSLAGNVTLELLTLNHEHFIHSSEYPLYFKLSAEEFDQLTGIDAGLVSGEESRK